MVFAELHVWVFGLETHNMCLETLTVIKLQTFVKVSFYSLFQNMIISKFKNKHIGRSLNFFRFFRSKEVWCIVFFNALYTLNKISNWSLFKLIISDQALIKLKIFLPIYMQFNGQKFSGLSGKVFFFYNPRFFW